MHRRAPRPRIRLAALSAKPPGPAVTRGEGSYVWDNRGRKILNGLSGLFVMQVGHGRRELAEVAAEQTAELMEQILRHTLPRSPGIDLTMATQDAMPVNKSWEPAPRPSDLLLRLPTRLGPPIRPSGAM